MVITGGYHALHETSDAKNEYSSRLTVGDYTNYDAQPNPAAIARLPLRWVAKVGERSIRNLQLRIPLTGA